MHALTARQIIVRIALIISLAELVIMIVLGMTGHTFDIYEEALLDTLMLVLIAAPAIYFWVINPFIHAHASVLDHANHLALTDSLTQISNRRQLLNFLQMTIASCKRHNHYGALLLIDLNRFKPINDNYGHDVGDAVLVEIAARLSKLVREEDAVGRLGGDEFILILSQLENNQASAINELGQITQRIVQSIKLPIAFAEHELDITASIGIRLIDTDPPDVETIIKQADEAMYIAKQSTNDFPVTFYQQFN